MIHIELLIFYFLTHYNWPSYSYSVSSSYSSDCADFFVSWGSRYPR